MIKTNKIKAAAVVGSVLIIGASVGIGIGVLQRKKNADTSTTDANEMSVTPRSSNENQAKVEDELDVIEDAKTNETTLRGDYIDESAHKDGHTMVAVHDRNQTSGPKTEKIDLHNFGKQNYPKEPLGAGTKGSKDSKGGSKTAKGSDGRGSAIHDSSAGKSKQEYSDTIHFVTDGKHVEGNNVEISNPLGINPMNYYEDSSWIDYGAWYDDVWSVDGWSDDVWSVDGWNDDGHTIEGRDSSVHVEYPTRGPKVMNVAMQSASKGSGPVEVNGPVATGPIIDLPVNVEYPTPGPKSEKVPVSKGSGPAKVNEPTASGSIIDSSVHVGFPTLGPKAEKVPSLPAGSEVSGPMEVDEPAATGIIIDSYVHVGYPTPGPKSEKVPVSKGSGPMEANGPAATGPIIDSYVHVGYPTPGPKAEKVPVSKGSGPVEVNGPAATGPIIDSYVHVGYPTPGPKSEKVPVSKGSGPMEVNGPAATGLIIDSSVHVGYPTPGPKAERVPVSKGSGPAEVNEPAASGPIIDSYIHVEYPIPGPKAEKVTSSPSGSEVSGPVEVNEPAASGLIIDSSVHVGYPTPGPIADNFSLLPVGPAEVNEPFAVGAEGIDAGDLLQGSWSPTVFVYSTPTPSPKPTPYLRGKWDDDGYIVISEPEILPTHHSTKESGVMISTTAASASPMPCEGGIKWHPNTDLTRCTNYPNYELGPVTEFHLYDSLEDCCLAIFGIPYCLYDNICFTPFSSVSSGKTPLTNGPSSSIKIVTPAASPSPTICEERLLWHPNPSLQFCTNDSNYPMMWIVPGIFEQYFYESVAECCKGTFGTWACEYVDVCATPSPSESPVVEIITSAPYKTNGFLDLTESKPLLKPADGDRFISTECETVYSGEQLVCFFVCTNTVSVYYGGILISEEATKYETECPEK